MCVQTGIRPVASSRTIRPTTHGKLVDLSALQHEIPPLIQGVPLSRLQKATGLSLRYVSLIRRGERTPHPGHWQRLLDTAAAD
jgi:hypothetical protein